MKFLAVFVLTIALYTTAESKPAVEVDLNGVVDEILGGLTAGADGLGISHLSIPDIDVNVGVADAELKDVKVENLELFVRKADVKADIPSLTAGATATVDLDIGFEKPVEVTADASVKVLILPVEGSLDATVEDLVAHVSAEITLLDESTFSVQLKELKTDDTKIDIDLEVAGIEADVLSDIVSELGGLLETTLNDVVGASLIEIINTSLSGKTFSLPV